MSRTLIIGGTGSLGKKLIERLNRDQLYVYSRDEAKHWTILQELKSQGVDDHVKFLVGDIRDYQRISEVVRRIQPTNIIIAAALKQVDTCELSPSESISTNLIGTQNVVRAVHEYPSKNVQKVLFVSTDKACSPVNVYGMCKALSERVVTSQVGNLAFPVKFMCTRYGNVLESRGSIIPLFKYQAENAEALTVTDPNMTRFLMTLDDSVDLIENALKYGKNGETWIPKIPAMRIGDLAEIFSEKFNKPIKITGLRPGEKMHEDLINVSESTRTVLKNNHYVIGAALAPATGEQFSYSSNNDVMTKIELAKHLDSLGVLDWSLDKFQGRKIEEIVK